MLAPGTAVAAIAVATGLSRQTVYRIKDDPAWADGLLARWALDERELEPHKAEQQRAAGAGQAKNKAVWIRRPQSRG
jgi:helix-turn-helix resolvase-like protein